jgi:hypothetical protein
MTGSTQRLVLTAVQSLDLYFELLLLDGSFARLGATGKSVICISECPIYGGAERKSAMMD